MEPSVPSGLLEFARCQMTDGVMMRNTGPSEKFRDQACQGAGAREENAETGTRFFRQKFEGDGGDGPSLLGGVETDQELRFAAAVRIGSGVRRLIEMDEGATSFRPVRVRRSRIEMFFPISDPRFVGCASLLAWIFEDHGCASCERNRRPQQRPERPVPRGESGEEEMAKPWGRALGRCQGLAISLMN